MEKYDYIAKLYTFASENGFKIKNLNVGERRNERGYYDYVSLALIVPREPSRKLESIVEKIEHDLDSAEAQKDNEV